MVVELCVADMLEMCHQLLLLQSYQMMFCGGMVVEMVAVIIVHQHQLVVVVRLLLVEVECMHYGLMRYADLDSFLKQNVMRRVFCVLEQMYRSVAYTCGPMLHRSTVWDGACYTYFFLNSFPATPSTFLTST